MTFVFIMPESAFMIRVRVHMLSCIEDLQQDTCHVLCMDADAVSVEMGKLSLISMGTAVTDTA